MTEVRVIGVDPGPVPGITMVHCCHGRVEQVHVVQCSWPIAGDVLTTLIRGGLRTWPRTLVQVEKFVVRGRNNGAQSLTRTQVAIMVATAAGCGALTIERPAAHVKPWATDERLDAAGLLDACKGMRHARDAARHALFAAVHDGCVPDPLSKEWRTR